MPTLYVKNNDSFRTVSSAKEMINGSWVGGTPSNAYYKVGGSWVSVPQWLSLPMVAEVVKTATPITGDTTEPYDPQNPPVNADVTYVDEPGSPHIITDSEGRVTSYSATTSDVTTTNSKIDTGVIAFDDKSLRIELSYTVDKSKINTQTTYNILSFMEGSTALFNLYVTYHKNHGLRTFFTYTDDTAQGNTGTVIDKESTVTTFNFTIVRSGSTVSVVCNSYSISPSSYTYTSQSDTCRVVLGDGNQSSASLPCTVTKFVVTKT